MYGAGTQLDTSGVTSQQGIWGPGDTIMIELDDQMEIMGSPFMVWLMIPLQIPWLNRSDSRSLVLRPKL